MKLLLDTCTFLHLIWDDPRLGQNARALLSDSGHAVFLSVVSIWEGCVKHRTGKIRLHTPEDAFTHFTRQRERHEIAPLPVDERCVRHLAGLPLFHHDPFDRLLICQAIEEGMAIVTPDVLIRRYPVKTLWDD